MNEGIFPLQNWVIFHSLHITPQANQQWNLKSPTIDKENDLKQTSMAG